MPGPPPKHPAQRRRRNNKPDLLALPAEGRKGRAPKWPLPEQSKAEAKVWVEMWHTPQAAAWERLGWNRTVARYVRFLVEAEKPESSVALLSEVRQLEDRLGLTPMSMLRLRWEVKADEVAEKREEFLAPVRRIRAVDTAAS